MEELLLVTNNSLIKEGDFPLRIQRVEGDFSSVLEAAKHLIYTGHELYTHPLPASIKMFLSPSWSIILRQPKQKGVTPMASAQLIEEAIDQYNHILGQRQSDWQRQADYELIDRDLVKESLALA